MTAPLALTGLEQAVRDVQAHLDKGQRRVFLYGRASSGKTSAMELLARQLRASGWLVHRTQMTRDDDAAPVALATLASRLPTETRDAILQVEVPWAQKVHLVVAGMTSAGAKTAVLVDDPWWGAPDDAPSMFAERSVDLLDGIERSNVSLVLAQSARPLAGAVVELPTAATPKTVLDPQRWQAPALRAAALNLAASHDPWLEKLSPVELRLAVVLASATSMTANLALQRIRRGPRALARAALEALGSAKLRRAITRLGVMRTPFDEATLDALLGDVSATDRALVLDALVFRTDEGLVVPELLTCATDELGSNDLRGAHQIAARYHKQMFSMFSSTSQQRAVEDPRGIEEATRHEMELVHHLTEAGDAQEVLDRVVWFVEQYDKLGKALSTRGVRSKKRSLIELAVKAYDRALVYDDEDAYAHHYRGYNLDILAKHPADAEAAYRRALELRPDHVWHHGRFITFLLTCGRIREAHDAWDEALRALDGLRDHRWLFRELHRPIARLLLHRGRLDFAREVLDDVPEGLGDTWLEPTRALLGQLQEAQADRLVFPASVPLAHRWDGPHLLLSEDERGRVSAWMPGRLERANGEIVVRFAKDKDTFGRRTYTAARFRKLCPSAKPTLPPAGTFVEILELEGSDAELIRCHPPSPLPDALPALFPPSDRYL